MVDPQLEQEIDLLHSRICQALADPKRVLLLYLLTDGAKCVSELVDSLGVRAVRGGRLRQTIGLWQAQRRT